MHLFYDKPVNLIKITGLSKYNNNIRKSDNLMGKVSKMKNINKYSI